MPEGSAPSGVKSNGRCPPGRRGCARRRSKRSAGRRTLLRDRLRTGPDREPAEEGTRFSLATRGSIATNGAVVILGVADQQLDAAGCVGDGAEGTSAGSGSRPRAEPRREREAAEEPQPLRCGHPRHPPRRAAGPRSPRPDRPRRATWPSRRPSSAPCRRARGPVPAGRSAGSRGGNNPAASLHNINDHTEWAPADWPNAVTLPASPPNAAMLSLHPPQRQDLITQAQRCPRLPRVAPDSRRCRAGSSRSRRPRCRCGPAHRRRSLADSPLPATYAPPWNHTMTGNRWASAGAVTVSTRQFSSVDRPSSTSPVTQPSRDGRCGQAGPDWDASRTPDQAGGGSGTANRLAVAVAHTRARTSPSRCSTWIVPPVMSLPHPPNASVYRRP